MLPLDATRKNRKRGEEILSPRMVAVGMILLIGVLAEVFFATWCGVQCRRTGYELVQAREEQEKLEEMRKKLQIERVRLESPQILGSYAREKLGLTTPKPDQIVIMP